MFWSVVCGVVFWSVVCGIVFWSVVEIFVSFCLFVCVFVLVSQSIVCSSAFADLLSRWIRLLLPLAMDIMLFVIKVYDAPYFQLLSIV